MANLSRLPSPIIEHWEWQYDGVCRTIDPDVFFPPDSERGPVRQRRESQAKQYCEHCPVLARCREHALMVQEPYGVWGGLTAGDRQRILDAAECQPRIDSRGGVIVTAGPGSGRTGYGGAGKA